MKTFTDDSDFDQKSDLKRFTKTIMHCKNLGNLHAKAIQIGSENSDASLNATVLKTWIDTNPCILLWKASRTIQISIRKRIWNVLQRQLCIAKFTGIHILKRFNLDVKIQMWIWTHFDVDFDVDVEVDVDYHRNSYSLMQKHINRCRKWLAERKRHENSFSFFHFFFWPTFFNVFTTRSPGAGS